MASSSDIAFVTTLVINVVLAILFLSLFIYFRRKVPKVYQPRCDGSATAPPPPSHTLFGWIGSTLRYSDNDLLRTHGMDAVIFINFLKMMLCITACMSLYGFIVLFPVNATGELARDKLSDRHVYGLEAITLSGVDTGSARLTAHLFSVVINSIIVYFFTYRMYRTYLHFRLRFKSSKERIENYTVLIRGVPANLDDQTLLSFFQELFPEKVVSVIRSLSCDKITEKIDERDKAKRALEKSHAVYRISGKRPTTKDKFLIGNVVDAIDWNKKKFDDLTNEVTTLQNQPLDKNPVVFVVFNDLSTASQCAQSIIDSRRIFLPEPAPEPRDLLWTHFFINFHQFMIRKIVMNIFFFLLVFFWIIPVTFVSSLSNLQTLSKIEGLRFIVDIVNLSPVLSGFLEGFLPTLAMVIFFALLVTIITAMVNKTGIYSKSELSRVVMCKYYVFQVFNVIIFYSITGSVLGVLDEFVNSDLSFSMVINLLANSLPKQSGFFVNYVMLLSLSGHTKALWNPGGLVVRWIKHKFLSKTAREWKEAETPGPYSYAVSYTNHLMVFTVLLLYSTLSPFIMIFGVLYFVMALVSNKYNIVYVNIPLWEGGGTHWNAVFYRVYAATILYQILFLGIFIVYQFPAGAIVSLICALCSIVMGWYIRKMFARSSDYLPLRYSVHRDEDLVEDISKTDLQRLHSEDPKIKMDQMGYSNVIGPRVPVYERNKQQITNLTSSLYYFQPSLLPLVDRPEFIVAPGKKTKIAGEEEMNYVYPNDSQMEEGVNLDIAERERREEEMEEIQLKRQADEI